MGRCTCSAGLHQGLNLSLGLVLLTLLLPFVLCSSALGQSTAPAEERKPRPINRSTDASSSTAQPAAGQPRPSGDFDWARVILSLAIVLMLILGLSWIGRRVMGQKGGFRSSGVMTILTRTPVGPRQQLMLVQIGKRLVVVSNTGAAMNPVCEISEPDEVAELMARIRQEKSDSISASFGSLFHRASSGYSAREEDNDTEKETADAETSAEPKAAGEDPEISQTREEVSGLMEKVRLLSKQFKGS